MNNTMSILRGKKREEFLWRVIDRAVALVMQKGTFVEVPAPWGVTRPYQATEGVFTIGYYTPFTRIPGDQASAPYGIDIWVKDLGKVFSAWWDTSAGYEASVRAARAHGIADGQGLRKTEYRRGSVSFVELSTVPRLQVVAFKRGEWETLLVSG